MHLKVTQARRLPAAAESIFYPELPLDREIAQCNGTGARKIVKSRSNAHGQKRALRSKKPGW